MRDKSRGRKRVEEHRQETDAETDGDTDIWTQRDRQKPRQRHKDTDIRFRFGLQTKLVSRLASSPTSDLHHAGTKKKKKTEILLSDLFCLWKFLVYNVILCVLPAVLAEVVMFFINVLGVFRCRFTSRKTC